MNYAITMTEFAKAELLEVSQIGEPDVDEIASETLFSLISPGTELNWGFFGEPPFPKPSGYATVSKVIQIGDHVKDIKVGDIIFSMGNHSLRQMLKADWTLPLPAGLDEWKGAIARLMGVSMTTLTTTHARPGDRVLVMGAGPVGFLAAHIFRISGYEVTVCDPDEERLQALRLSGINNVYSSISAQDPKLLPFALVLECSGHEQAILDGLRSVQMRGEVVMIGVPWKKRTEHSAHDIAWEVFHKYAVLRSGWEWELPAFSNERQPHSIFSNIQIAAKWLQEGRISLEGLIRKVSPRDAQNVYQGLAERTYKELFIVFDWSQI
ncbi:zinc-binding alcohol dehydrogenase [Paenibacillus psychroresistens]|uniref:Zinc-binding alcohol dehydrogenase n=1 Tax=Paenibacillus psychroresistens TaxID=1778678 RepID=A0A6B8RPL6_9BACL|nr:zinc-binding alcohol dehydrogenase [Paenibacillus psychroresistens]QGQ97754.1 zinc-binding alcohol dehydrogenase [Paenibacillus psychroresistens]